MKYVLFYDLADGAEALAQEHFPAHSARLTAFHERGLLLMVGTFTDLPRGAMGCSPVARPWRSSWPTTRSCSTAWWPHRACGSGTRS